MSLLSEVSPEMDPLKVVHCIEHVRCYLPEEDPAHESCLFCKFNKFVFRNDKSS